MKQFFHRLIPALMLVFGLGIAVVQADERPLGGAGAYDRLKLEDAMTFLDRVMTECSDVDYRAYSSCEESAITRTMGGPLLKTD